MIFFAVTLTLNVSLLTNNGKHAVSLSSLGFNTEAQAEAGYGNGSWGNCYYCSVSRPGSIVVKIVCYPSENHLCIPMSCHNGWC